MHNDLILISKLSLYKISFDCVINPDESLPGFPADPAGVLFDRFPNFLLANLQRVVEKMDFTQETVFPDYLLQKNQEAAGQNLKLFNAVVAGSSLGVETALEKGAKPNYFHRPEDNKNSLHVASEDGKLEIVQMLLKAGAVVDATAVTSKTTALILAAGNGHNPVVQTLIDAGADVNARNMYGNTALHEAARVSTETCALLVARGADVAAINNKGSTALHFACYEEEDMNVTLATIRVLCEAGANCNAADSKGMTPVLVCATTGHLDAIKFLKESGADMDAKDVQGRDMKAIAAFFSHTNIVAFLEPKEENTKPAAANRGAKTKTQMLSDLPVKGKKSGALSGSSASSSRGSSSTTRRSTSPRSSRTAPSTSRPGAKTTAGTTGGASGTSRSRASSSSSSTTKKVVR